MVALIGPCSIVVFRHAYGLAIKHTTAPQTLIVQPIFLEYKKELYLFDLCVLESGSPQSVSSIEMSSEALVGRAPKSLAFF